MNERLFQRFAKKVRVDPDGCARWTASIFSSGYGQFSLNNQNCLAHRVSYELFVGDIPAGKVIDHVCRNRECVNPEHLEPVTQKENVARGRTGQKTAAKQLAKAHCPRGHEYAGSNLYTWKNTRMCRACRKFADIKRKEKT